MMIWVLGLFNDNKLNSDDEGKGKDKKSNKIDTVG